MTAVESMEVPNLLAAVAAADVVHDPFPHVVVPGAIPTEWADRLNAEFPPDAVVEAGSAESARGSNQRFSMYASAVARSREISPLWQRFIEEQSSPRFLRHALRIFGAA